MAGSSIPFLSRQTVTVVPGGGSTYYYSDPFDLTAYETLTVSFRVFGLIGTSPSVDLAIEVSDRISAPGTDWQDWGENFTAVSAAPSVERKTVTSGIGRYARAKITISGGAGDVAATIEVMGTAREGG